MLIALLATSYLALQNSWVQTRITRYVAATLSEKLNTNISVGKVNIRFFRKVYFEDILFEDQAGDTLLFSHLLTASIDTFKFRQQILQVDELSFSGNKLKINRDTANIFNFNFLLQELGKKQERSFSNWLLSCNAFQFSDVDIDYFDYHEQDVRNVYVSDLDLTVSKFKSVADSVHFFIDNLSMNDDKSLELKTLNAAVTIKAREVNITNCNLESRHSRLSNTALKLNLPSKNDSTNQALNLDLRIGNSLLSFREVGAIIPGFKGMDQVVELSGQIYGNINDLKGKNIWLSTGQETNANLDFYMNEPRDLDNMYLFIDLKQSQTSFSDISNVRLPDISSIPYLRFPESFYEAGLLEFKGNFSGFLSDFVTFGTLQSEMGTLNTDMLVTPEKQGNIYYRGNLSTENFDLGRLFIKDYLGKLTFSGSVDGNYNRNSRQVSGVFKGDVSRIDINDYTYHNIRFDGILLDKMFDGLLTINDPNLKFSFLGQVDLNREIPDFDFVLQLDRANPGQLNLGKSFPNAEMAFVMNANFTGNRIDNMDGTIRIEEGFYKNRNGEIQLGGTSLRTRQQNHMDSLQFKSEFIDLEVDGNYHFRGILQTVNRTLHRFLPAFSADTTFTNGFENNFTYRINIKEGINSVADAFVPGLQIDKSFLLYGIIDSDAGNIELEGSIPGIRYNNFIGRDIFIGNKIINEDYTSKFRFGEIHIANGMNLYNFKIDSRIANDTIDNTVSWSNYDELTYSGELCTQTVFSRSDSTNFTHIEIKGQPSKIFIADTVWTISPFEVIIDSSTVFISGFKFENRDQLLAIDGSVQKNRTDMLRLQLLNFKLEHLETYLNKDFQITGVANGTFGFVNLLTEPMFLSDLNISNFTYKNQLMGDINLTSKWNSEKSWIDSQLKVILEDRTKLSASGNYKPSTNELDFETTLDSVSLIVLETFMRKNFSNFRGYGSGTVHLGGTADRILLNGALMGADAGLTIDVTQIPYSFNDSVYFKNDTILFDNILIADDQDNTGRFNGTIVHKNFQEMAFNLAMTSDKIRALNTTLRDNEKFYGVAVASGRFDITGQSERIFMNGSVTSLQGTEVNISMESESEVEQYDFIEFVTPESTEESNFYKVNKMASSKINLNLAIEATPDAKVQLIYNSQIGDIIKAQGEGILIFEMNEDGEISLSGNYRPTKGDYLFTLQNVINKRFTIEQGGSIVWSGDPYNAVIDLKAVYKLRASLYDLLGSEYGDISPNQRVQVECIIHLEDELVNPTISFEINFPNTEGRDRDEIQQFFNTDDELNRQILSLIVMGKFYTPEYMRGNYEAQNTNMFGTTASEVFSNQLSNWLSQIDENWDVGINYRPGNNVTDDEIELALSTQIFNDRVTLNGNIGNNVNQYSTNSSQIVGDFEINVKLVPSGKLQFKAYNRSNNNLIYETAPYTQGIGLSLTEEYNTLDELLTKLGNLFRSKKKPISADQ